MRKESIGAQCKCTRSDSLVQLKKWHKYMLTNKIKLEKPSAEFTANDIKSFVNYGETMNASAI